MVCADSTQFQPPHLHSQFFFAKEVKVGCAQAHFPPLPKIIEWSPSGARVLPVTSAKCDATAHRYPAPLLDQEQRPLRYVPNYDSSCPYNSLVLVSKRLADFRNPFLSARWWHHWPSFSGDNIFALGNYSDRVIDKRWLRKLLVENYPITPS